MSLRSKRTFANRIMENNFVSRIYEKLAKLNS